MKKVTKLICLVMALVILSTSFVFAAGSKSTTVKHKGKQYGEYTGYTKTKKATFTGVKKTKRASIKTKVIAKSFKKDGKTYTVNKVVKNAFKGCKKLRKITYKGKVALKFASGAFSGVKTSKITFKCYKKSMSKATFAKIKKNLKKAGFKGKIVRA